MSKSGFTPGRKGLKPCTEATSDFARVSDVIEINLEKNCENENSAGEEYALDGERGACGPEVAEVIGGGEAGAMSTERVLGG